MYPEDSLLGLAQRKAAEFWQKTIRFPGRADNDRDI
jgi:hypothetical protein